MAANPGSSSVGLTPTLCRLREEGTWLLTQFSPFMTGVREASATDASYHNDHLLNRSEGTAGLWGCAHIEQIMWGQVHKCNIHNNQQTFIAFDFGLHCNMSKDVMPLSDLRFLPIVVNKTCDSDSVRTEH